MQPISGVSQIQPRSVIIVGQLLLVAALAFVASQRQLMLVLVLPLAIGVGLTIIRWPSLGLIFASVSGLVVPYLGPSGLNVTMILIALLVGLWLLDMIVYQRELKLAPSPTTWPLLLFLAVAVFSFGLGQLPWFSFVLHAPLGAQLGGMSIIVLSAATFLLVANQLHDLRWLSWLTWVFLIIGGISVLFRSLLPTLGLPTGSIFQPVGTLFHIWLVVLAFSQALFNKDLHRGWRLVLGGLVLANIYFRFVANFDDKSGWIPVFAGLAAVIAARSWRAGLALTPIAVLAVLSVWARVVSSDDYSISTRFDAWIIMGQIIKISPIWGLGFANYYWYTPLFPIRGYAVSFNSHNNYVDIVAQTGVVGLVCFVWLVWEIGKLGWRLRNDVPTGFARAYVYGALGGLVGMVVAGMLGDWVLPFFYNLGLNGFRTSMLGWLFLGGLVSLEQMVRKQRFAIAQK